MTQKLGDRPIRKRGFHRALKRREVWAVMKEMTSRMNEQISREFFGLSQDSSSDEVVGLKELLKRYN